MKAEEILDELHEIREKLMEKYRGQPNDVFILDLHARTAKICEELGLKPAEPRGGSNLSSASGPDAKKG